MTNLESLANELLLDLFEYFDTIHLFRAFQGLNSRFNSLLFNNFQAYRLDLRFASKHNFDIFCNTYIQQIGHKAIALRLSNDDDTPQQIECFLYRYDHLLVYFTRLTAFSLYHVLSEETMTTVCMELNNFPTLIRLDIVQCTLPCYHDMDFSSFINRVWSLPKLIYCNLDFDHQSEEHFEAPRVSSSTIEYVSIKGIQFDFHEINLLFEQTSSLRYLRAHNTCVTDDIVSTSSALSLIKLNLSFLSMNENVITTFLQNMLNLRYLTIDMYGVFINGYQWEKIIRDYLPSLKIFRLKEQIPLLDQNEGDEEMDTIVKSFQNQFWLEERKWFIQCDWNMTGTYSFFSLYTLPYSFTEFDGNCVLKSKSTRPQNNNKELYHRVHKLHYNTCSLDDISLTYFQFFNLRHLIIEAPVNDRFCSILAGLDQLSTLNISLSDDDTNLSQLQTLVNQATNMKSLTINSSSSSLMMSFIQNTNITVHRLYLQGDNQLFDDEQYKSLINSPLGVGCQILGINIMNCNNVIDLVNNMINLRALKVRHEGADEDYLALMCGHDEFVEQLCNCLPSTCIITRSKSFLDDIHIWIR